MNNTEIRVNYKLLKTLLAEHSETSMVMASRNEGWELRFNGNNAKLFVHFVSPEAKAFFILRYC